MSGVPEGLHGRGPSRLIPLDYAGPGRSRIHANYVRILAGETVATHPGGRPAWCHVLQGTGRSRDARAVTTWREGDAFLLTSGGTAAHAAADDATLLWLYDEAGTVDFHRAMRLEPGETTPPRRVAHPVWIFVFEAGPECETLVGGSLDPHGRIASPSRTSWEPGSGLAIPGGAWFSHRNESPTEARFVVVGEGSPS